MAREASTMCLKMKKRNSPGSDSSPLRSFEKKMLRKIVVVQSRLLILGLLHEAAVSNRTLRRGHCPRH